MAGYKLVSGTFLDGIASDIPSNNWGEEDWQKQFDNMSEIGMDTVVIIRVGYEDSAMYDSDVMRATLFPENDMVELFCREADRTGLRLYMGLFDSGKYWLKNDWEAEVEINIKLIEELWEKYRHHKSFYGWYLSHEGEIGHHMPKIWEPLVKKMKTYDDGKKILISPRYAGEKYHRNDSRYIVSPEQHYRHFDYILGEMGGLIDEAAFMDGHVAFGDLETFVETTHRVCVKHGVEFWSNLETFDRDVPWKFPPIEWMKMRFKMDVVQPYAEKIITFEAPHFLSPYSAFPSARTLYLRYREYGEAKKI